MSWWRGLSLSCLSLLAATSLVACPSQVSKRMAQARQVGGPVAVPAGWSLDAAKSPPGSEAAVPIGGDPSKTTFVCDWENGRPVKVYGFGFFNRQLSPEQVYKYYDAQLKPLGYRVYRSETSKTGIAQDYISPDDRTELNVYFANHFNVYSVTLIVDPEARGDLARSVPIP